MVNIGRFVTVVLIGFLVWSVAATDAQAIDTRRTLSTLQTIFADNVTGDISPQDLRDGIISTYPYYEDVLNHGADNTGATDASTEIQAAIDAAEVSGGAVFFPTGTYLINTRLTVSSNVKLFGVPGASILKNGLAASNPDGIININSSSSNIVFEDLILDGDDQAIATSGNSGVVKISGGGQDIHFNRVTVRNTVSNGIAVFDSGINVTNSKFLDIDKNGIRADVTGQAVRIQNNRFETMGENGVFMTGVSTPITVSESAIVNNVFKDMNDIPGGDGPFGNAIVLFFVSSVVVSGNHMIDMEWSGVRISHGQYITVVGNTITDPSQAGQVSDAAIWSEFSEGEGNIIVGNTVRNFINGITVTNFADDPVGHAVVVANNSLLDGLRGVFCEADCVITGNLINGAIRPIVVGKDSFTRDVLVANNLMMDTRAESKRSDVVVNGTFASDASWDKGTGWTISGGNASKSSGSASDLDQNTILAAGETHRIIYTVSGRTAGTITAKCGSGGTGTSRSTNATFTEDLVCSGSTDLIFTADSSFDGNVDDAIAFQVTKNAIEVSSHASAGDVFVIGNVSKGIAGKPYVGTSGGALGDNIYFSGNFNPLPTADRPTAALGGSMHYDSTTGLMNYYDDSAGSWTTF